MDELEQVKAERDRLRKAIQDQSHRIEQTLGLALGYPRYCDSPGTFPDATEADGVCVFDMDPESLAQLIAERYLENRQILKERAEFTQRLIHQVWDLKAQLGVPEDDEIFRDDLGDDEDAAGEPDHQL